MSMTAEEAERALSKAVANGDVDEVSRLFDTEPHLHEATGPGFNLYMAALRGNVAMIRLLLEIGADVNHGPIFGMTPLYCASWAGHEEAVSVLLSYGADSTRKCERGFTAFMMACSNGRRGVVRQLLQHMQGCGLDDRDDKDAGFTESELLSGCAYGRLDIVRDLLLAGADHTIAGRNGRTPRQLYEHTGLGQGVALLEVSPRCAFSSRGPCSVEL
jgi:ankyrin repeat protein